MRTAYRIFLFNFLLVLTCVLQAVPNRVYVASLPFSDPDTGSVNIYDTQSFTLIGSIANIGLIKDIIASPDGQSIYVLYLNRDKYINLATINANTNTIVQNLILPNTPPIKDDLVLAGVLSPNGSLLYITIPTNADPKIYALNVSLGIITSSYPLEQNAIAIAITPDGKNLFVSTLSEDIVGSLDKINIVTGAKITSSQDPATSIAISPDSHTAYILTYSSFTLATIKKINTDSLALISETSFPCTVNVDGIAFKQILASLDGTKIYAAASFDENTVQCVVLDANTLEILDTIKTAGLFVGNIALSSDGSALYLASNNSETEGNLITINTLNNQIISSINSSGNNFSIATFPSAVVPGVLNNALQYVPAIPMKGIRKTL